MFAAPPAAPLIAAAVARRRLSIGSAAALLAAASILYELSKAGEASEVGEAGWGAAGIESEKGVGGDGGRVTSCISTPMQESAKRPLHSLHGDVRWDHVGLYKKSGNELGAVLIDLGIVEPVEPAGRGEARDRMLAMPELL